MIGKLKGSIDAIGFDYVILDVGGLCYNVYLSARDIHCVNLGLNVSIWICQITKDDGVTLYGFLELRYKAWFNELIKLSGISGRMAINILGCLSADNLELGILSKDEKFFETVPGIGKKIANRIVNELFNAPKKVASFMSTVSTCNDAKKDKACLTSGEIIDRIDRNASDNCDTPASDNRFTIILQVSEALRNLGFQGAYVQDIVKKIVHKDDKNVDLATVIKLALKELNHMHD